MPARGARTVQAAISEASSKLDCFYVYPTVSTEPSQNSDLRVRRAEIDVAIEQASRFSQICQVWAPMYRQRTVDSIAEGLGADPQGNVIAYDSLLAAWRSFLAEDAGDRPIVFIGHSQGAAMLIRLLQQQVDPNPALRARTVMAIILGGNVAVPTGREVGGTFAHLPLCTAAGEDRCVIAYSSFPGEPPPGSPFGRPGQGVSVQSGQTASAGLEVACVNPAALTGGTAALDPYFPTGTAEPAPPAVTTPWVNFPDLYQAACRSRGGATWLQVSTLDVAGRPTVSEVLGAAWGYHADDVNLALGNLVADVRAAETTWLTARS